MSEQLAPTVIDVAMITVATGSSDDFPFFYAPVAGQVLSVHFFHSATVAGDASNNFVITLNNGTVAMATRTNTTLNPVAADTAWALTMSTTAANTKFAAGDTLKISKTEGGTGAAITAPVRCQVTLLLGAYES